MNCEKGRISSTIVFSPPFQQGKQTENKAIAFLCFPVSIIEQRTKKNLHYLQFLLQNNIHPNTYTWDITCDVAPFGS
jgi:hypothetical protein